MLGVTPTNREAREMASMGPFWSHNRRSNRFVLTHDERRHILDQRLASYLQLGWSVVAWYDDPPRVRITHRVRQDVARPLPAEMRDPEDRIVWVDEVGQLRVDPLDVESR